MKHRLNKKYYLLSGLVALALALALPTAFAFATPAEEKQAEADAAYEQLQEMQAAYEEAEQAYEAAYDAQLTAEAAVEDATARIDAANARIDQLQALMSRRARTMYCSGNLTILDLLFGATSFEEFANNWDLLAILNQNDADMIQETKDLKAEIEAQKIILVEQQKIATQKAEEAAQAVKDAEAVVAEMQSVYDSLSEEAAELLAEEQAAAEEAARLAALQQINNNNNGGGSDDDDDDSGSGGSYNNDYSGRADAGSTVGRAYAIMNEGDCYYSWGGVGPYGFDCSGFVSYCLTGSYSRLGTTYTFLNWTEVSDPQPGDICVNSGHTGVYIGGGQMIHAASTSEGIIVGPVQSGMIYVRY